MLAKQGKQRLMSQDCSSYMVDEDVTSFSSMYRLIVAFIAQEQQEPTFSGLFLATALITPYSPTLVESFGEDVHYWTAALYCL